MPRNKPFDWLYVSCIGLVGAGVAIAGTQHNLDGFIAGGLAFAVGLVGLLGLAYDTRGPKESEDT